MWGRIVSSVSNALDFNQATLSGCIDIICVRNPHTGELHSTPFHVRFGKAKLLRSREKIVSVTVNNKPTALVMKLGAAGEAYFMQEVEDSIGVAEEDLASPLSSPVHSPRRECGLSTDASMPPAPQDSNVLPPSHPVQGVTLSTAASAVLADTRRPADPQTGSDLARGTSGLSPSLGTDGSLPKGAPSASVTTQDASSTWRSAWGTAARYESNAGLMEGSPSGSLPEAERTLGRQAEEGRAAVQFSLCGHVLFGTADEAQHDADVFEANLVTWEALDENPSLWYHPSLVACFERTPPYYPAKVALPLLASWLLFNRPLSLDSVKRLMTADITYTDREGASWAPWQTDGVGSSSGVLRPRPEPLSSAEFSQASAKRDQLHGATFSSGVNSDSESPAFAPSMEPSTGKRLRRSLRPTPQQLESLDLKPGANSVCFTVSSSLQGEKSVCGTIYLWPTDIKIVVSDVDGTITRSDVLGQLMPIVGRDWSHTGVAELFTKIKRSGYLILYLTARAIGQADATRDYLFGLTQKERDKLPDGPLILSPDRLFPSFRREVIDRKPYIFKIAALRDIRSLFPANRNPFYAGFGNRESDHRAYIHVGIPEAKIFIIDTAGVIHHISNSTYARTYETMSEIADHMFPPLKNSPVSRGQPGQELEEREEEEFNAFNYWSVAFEPHMEYGESEGGISDEEEDSSVPITSSVTGTAVLPESQSPQTPTAVLPPPSSMPGKRTLALNYYFGLDQAEGGRSSLPQTDAATAVASIGASGVEEDSSSSSDSSESLFDGLSRSSSNSSNTSSSSSTSSTSSYLRDPQLEISTSVGIAAAQQHLEEPTESIRRSASEGAELASLDRSEGASSSTQKQQERPSTANAPGRLLLPSVVSISAFRLGPIGFRRVKSAADAAPGIQQPTAPAAACASASEGSTEAPAAVVDAVGLDGSAVVEGHLQTAMHPQVQLPLDGFSLSPPATNGGSVAIAAESGHVLQPLAPGFRAAALLGLQVKEAEAGAATQTVTRTSETTGASTGEFPAAGRVEQHLSMGDTDAAGDSCRGSCMALASASSNLGISIAPSENRRSKSEDAAPACSSLRIGTDTSVVLEGLQPKGCRASAQTGAVSHADSSSRRNVAPAHFTSARFEAEPPPVSGVAPPSSATRLWLPRSTREMHACSSTSAMFMALAQETPERARSPESSKVGMPRNSFSAAFAAAGAATKAGEAAARETAGIRASTAGTADGLGSYSSFESTDPLTSRCDSFASAASRTRNDDEAHVAGLQQMQQKKGDGTAEDCQHMGNRSADTSAVPRTASYESLLTGNSKEAGEASPPSSRSSVS